LARSLYGKYSYGDDWLEVALTAPHPRAAQEVAIDEVEVFTSG